MREIKAMVASASGCDLKRKLLTILAVGLFAGPMAANAEVRTWDFTVTIDYGTGLPLGTALTGFVSVDDAGLPLGVGISQIGLVTDLSFSFGGVTYDETTANTGYLEFNADGSLKALSFGSNCFAGGCGAGAGQNQWFLIIGSFRVGSFDPDDFDFAGFTTSGISVRGDMTFEERLTPDDPIALLAQLATAVTGVGPGTSLADKLAVVQAYLAVPDIQSACLMLDDFINQVRAQRGKKIAPAVADQLTADADSIKAAIPCR